MQLTEEMKFIQNILVEKAHPWLSLEEAKQSELIKWCLYEMWWEIHTMKSSQHSIITPEKVSCVWLTKFMDEINPVTHKKFEFWDKFYSEITYRHWYYWNKKLPRLVNIFWLPPTLSRVLNGLGDKYYYHPYYKYIYRECDIDTIIKWKNSIISTASEVCERYLLNEDWSDKTLFEQPEHIITAIAREMWYKSE